MRKLLIADSVEEFRLALTQKLKGIYRIRVCRDGEEALEQLCAFKPDLAVLDILLPGLDGISILEEAARRGIRPVILATSKDPSDYVVKRVTELGAAYMMVKPCKIKYVVDRLRDLEGLLDADTVSRPEPRTEVTNVLLTLGLAAKLDGYTFVREAILEMMAHPGLMITKELYPAVGKICGGAGSIQVERSIRSAINKAWTHRDEAQWRRFFADAVVRSERPPSNGVFITTVADRLNTEIFAQNP